jgi:hypothetical protein
MKHIPAIDFIGGKRYYFRKLFEPYPFQSVVRERRQEKYRADVAETIADFRKDNREAIKRVCR